MRLWWTIVKWMFKAGLGVWFVLVPLMPVYGALRPWPQARTALRDAGISGAPLMIGAASDSEHSWSSAGHTWREDRQRSFVVLPDSFHGGRLFTYFEARGSSIEGVKSGIMESHTLLVAFVLWIVAGLVSLRTLRQLQKIWRTSRSSQRAT